eukprot:4026977-Pyramimonas_sp.AAC.1
MATRSDSHALASCAAAEYSRIRTLLPIREQRVLYQGWLSGVFCAALPLLAQEDPYRACILGSGCECVWRTSTLSNQG